MFTRGVVRPCAPLFAVVVLLIGCTADLTVADPAPNEGADAAADGTDAARRADRPAPGALARTDAAAAADGPDAGSPDTGGPDVVGDADHSDTHPPGEADSDAGPGDAAACPTRCAYPGATGRFRRLGQSCVDSLDCCSNDCWDPTPGDGAPGTCVAPGPPDGHWCGGLQEYCPDAAGTVCPGAA